MSVLEAFVRPIRRGTWPVRITAAIGWTYLVAAFAAWMLLIYTSEHLIFGTVIAYGPRWLALLPLVLLVPAALILARTALLPLALGAFIVAVPIMGARVSPSTLFAGAPPATPAAGTFRVATFNTRGGRGLAVDLVPFFELYKPDVVMFQECGDVLWDALQKQSAWHSARHGTLCTASQWPMGDYETMPRDELAAISERGFGGTGLVMRVRYGSPNGPLDVVNLHLETARRGLEGMLSPQGLVPDNPLGGSGTTDGEESAADQENEERFEMNAAIRDRESNLASRWAVDANSPAPMIIAGDFNMPVESTIYRRYWARFNDAFEERGNGLGWTKVEGRWLRIRIDHMLTTDGGPKPQRVRIGANFLSDHLPVIVDYAWPTR